MHNFQETKLQNDDAGKFKRFAVIKALTNSQAAEE